MPPIQLAIEVVHIDIKQNDKLGEWDIRLSVCYMYRYASPNNLRRNQVMECYKPITE